MKSEGIALLPLNIQVDEFNEFVLQQLNEPTVTIKAIDSAKRTSNKGKRGGKAKQATAKKPKASDTGGLAEELKVAVGARVMLRRNLDTSQGLVNGAFGEIVMIHQQQNVVTRLTIRWDHGKTSELGKETSQFEIVDKVFATRKQFPIALAYGITVHKCQGLSLTSALVYLGVPELFESAMAYVALSRVKKLKQLHIIKLDAITISARKEAVHEYNRLRTSIGMAHLPPHNCLPKHLQVQRANQNKGRKPMPIPKVSFPAGMAAVVVSHQLRLQNPHFECYMNSTIQTLLALDKVMTTLEQNLVHYDKPAALRTAEMLLVYKSAKMNNETMNCRLFREHIQEVVERDHNVNYGDDDKQQDASEFLNDILTLCLEDDVRQLFQHSVTETTVCNNSDCGLENEQPAKLQTVLYTKLMKDLSKETFKDWFQGQLKTDVDMRCILCSPGVNTRHTKTSVVTIPQQAKYLAILIDRFDAVGFTGPNNDPIYERSKKQLTRFNANNCQLFGSNFRVMSALVHIGTSPHSGHYKVKVRDGDRWIWLDDDKPVGKKENFITNLTDVRLLVLEKRAN